uniref:Putative secreted protein n=1 Tax=Panstrongylus lignarius TaxID=156445 RepID=A0A224Y4W1_9HEMI
MRNSRFKHLLSYLFLAFFLKFTTVCQIPVSGGLFFRYLIQYRSFAVRLVQVSGGEQMVPCARQLGMFIIVNIFLYTN